MDRKATGVAVGVELSEGRTGVDIRSLWHHWKPLIVPIAGLWALATVVSCTIVKPFDVGEYATYAHAALRAPLLHRLPLEYPAPAVALFLVPLLLPLSYPWVFAVFCGVAMVLLVISYERSGVVEMDREAALRLVVYLTAGSIIIVTGRYDIFAAAFGFWSVRAARQERWTAAWAWSSVGFVIKLFPAVFWPAFLIAEWRRLGRVPYRRLCWMVGSAAVVGGIPYLLNRGATLNVLHYYVRRPTEIESIPAGLSVLIDPLRTHWISSFHSVNVVNGAGSAVSGATEILAVALCLWIWRAQLRDQLPFEAACLASLSVVVLGGKVLSPQYLIWLMPLWALYPIRPQWLFACVLSSLVFPYIVSVQHFGYVAAYPLEMSSTLAFL
ncbi:MAG: glycosyltransferase 87 family protein, partial [Acidimicrobiales bacterium]